MTDPTQSPPTGDSAAAIAVGSMHGKVVLQFHQPAQWIDLEPGTAVEVAKSMIQAAVDSGARVTIQAPRAKVPNAIRSRMEARALHILTNKRGAAERDAVLAVRLVDTLLNMLEL